MPRPRKKLLEFLHMSKIIRNLPQVVEILDEDMQQFMATTTGTITIATDVPRCGREALYDTMVDISYTLAGAVPTAIYYFFVNDFKNKRTKDQD